jgi:hypothetical protein
MNLSNLFKTLAFILIMQMTSCSDENELTEARVVGFSANKCMCCWGWTIAIGSDTIRTESDIVGGKVGYDIDEPVPVIIRLGKKSEDCPLFEGGRQHYEIDFIRKVN